MSICERNHLPPRLIRRREKLLEGLADLVEREKARRGIGDWALGQLVGIARQNVWRSRKEGWAVMTLVDLVEKLGYEVRVTAKRRKK